MTCPFSLWLSSVLHKMTSDFVFQNNSRTEKKKNIYIYIAQSCPTLCCSMDCSLPGSSGVAIPFSKGSSRPKDLTLALLITVFFTVCATRDRKLQNKIESVRGVTYMVYAGKYTEWKLESRCSLLLLCYWQNI